MMMMVCYWIGDVEAVMLMDYKALRGEGGEWTFIFVEFFFFFSFFFDG